MTEPADGPQHSFDNPSHTALFDYVEALMASEEGKHPPGSLQHAALERYKAVLKEARQTAEKVATVDPDNAQALLKEAMIANTRILSELVTCSTLLARAGIDFDRDLLRKLQEFKLPDSH